MVCDRPLPSPMSYCRHLPHSNSSSSSSYSPSTKSQDISRLLDPSYASSSTSSTYPAAYVDHDGEVHDPDYRHFPSPSFSDASRRHRRTHQQRRDHRRWASDDDYESDSDEEDTEDMDEVYSRSRSPRPSSSCRHHHRRSRDLSPLPLALPALSTSPSPSSYSSDLWLSADDDEFDAPHSERVLRKKRAPSSSKKSLFGSPPKSSTVSHFPPTFTYTYSSEPSSPEFAELEVDERAVSPESLLDRPLSPSKREAVRKELSALQLSLSIGMFRMKKRVRGVISKA